MTIKELIKELKSLPNQDRDVSIVVGDEDNNSVDAYQFEIHHAADSEHPIELFVYQKDAQFYV